MPSSEKLTVYAVLGNTNNRYSFLTDSVLERLNSRYNLILHTAPGAPSPEEYNEKLRLADVCVTGWGTPALGENALRGVTRLKLLAHTGGSVAGLASPALYDMGVKVVSGNKIYAESVAEGALAMMLCSGRLLVGLDTAMHNGEWPKLVQNRGLFGKKIGLVGFGAIARTLCTMLKSFRADISAYDPFVDTEVFAQYGVECASLEQLFSQSDIISLHLAGTDDTNGVITRALLQSIKKGALFVNTARANTVDEAALIDELKTGRFSAAIDVYHSEPLSAQSELRRLPNVLLTPHCAGPTFELREVVSHALIDDVERFYAGEPLMYEIGRGYALKMSTK